MVLLGKIVLSVVALLLVARSAYPAFTRHQAKAQEQSAKRNKDGIRVGMEPFALGSGDTVLVFIHGFASGPSVFRQMAPALAEHGFDCRVLRLPGFGEPMERMGGVGESDWRRAVADEVAHAGGEGKRVWLIGHSMGGTLALDYALSNPDRIEGLILLAPMIEVSSRRSCGLPPEWMQRIASGFLPEHAVLETVFPVDLNARSADHDELRDRVLLVSMYTALFQIGARIKGRGAELRLPVLLALPGSDRVVSRRATLAYFSTLSSADKELLAVPRAAHVIPLDYGWEDVTRRMESYINEAAQRGVHR